MIKKISLLIILLLTSCSAWPSPNPPDLAASEGINSPEQNPTAESQPTLPSDPPPSPDSTPANQPFPAKAWAPYTSSTEQVWALENGDFHQVELPFAIGQYYDYSPQTGKILYASHFAAVGGGPGMVAVSDLWSYDWTSGEKIPLIELDSVVEALWVPGSDDLIYILAAPDTYELRVRTAAGEDRLLAKDVSFNWSISPTGQHAAFTRESGYELDVRPGLYVVDLAGGEERMLLEIDLNGMGSIDDRPIWFPDGLTVLFSNWASQEKQLFRAAVDGSRTEEIAFDPAIASEWWAVGGIQTALVFPDGLHLAGISGGGKEPFGPPWLVVYELNEEGNSVIGGDEVMEVNNLIDWAAPGASVWVIDSEAKSQKVEIP